MKGAFHMKNAKVQIDYSLFCHLAIYVGQHPHPDDSSYNEIRSGILSKIDAMLRHDMYTWYKSARTQAEREEARLEYLEKAGISEGFRWNPEYKEAFKKLLRE